MFQPVTFRTEFKRIFSSSTPCRWRKIPLRNIEEEEKSPVFSNLFRQRALKAWHCQGRGGRPGPNVVLVWEVDSLWEDVFKEASERKNTKRWKLNPQSVNVDERWRPAAKTLLDPGDNQRPSWFWRCQWRHRFSVSICHCPSSNRGDGKQDASLKQSN